MTTSRGRFRAKVIVGADGPFSDVARCASLPLNRNMATAVVCNVDEEFSPDVRMYFGSVAPKGYAWTIPKRNGANIGLGVQASGLPLKRLLSHLFRRLGLDLKKTGKMHACRVPISGPLSQTVRRNILLVGDAAGHVMPTNGGGVPIGMICGSIAAGVISRHVNDGVPLLAYEQEWRQAVGHELKISLRTKRLADMFAFRNDWMTTQAISFLGSKGLEKAVKCKRLLW